VPFSKLDGLAFGFLSLTAIASTLVVLICSQIAAQRPANQGVMTVHLGKRGELRLWNQSIRPQELPLILDRAHQHSPGPSPLVIRLIPDPEVPWGVVQLMLARLQPRQPLPRWRLQLQLP
jgi:hypothetical protein